MNESLLEETKHAAAHQLDRLGVLLCRLGLDLRRSYAVDLHAQRILLAHLAPYDIAFLKRVLGATRVDLARMRESAEPSFFCGMLWTLALDQRWGEPMPRQVEYAIGSSTFQMQLDLNLAPECTYYADDPTPTLTRVLRCGGQVFYDIGAHVGLHSLTGGMFFEHTHAFEPTPETLVRLHRNRALNPNARLHIHAVALSSTDRLARLRTHRLHPGNNTLVDSPDQDAIEVAASRLDSYRQENALPSPDLIKIDVEGHEYEVIAGATATITESRPTLFVEFNGTENFRRVVAKLPASYEAYVDDGRGAFTRLAPTAEIPRALDVLFVDQARRPALFDALTRLK